MDKKINVQNTLPKQPNLFGVLTPYKGYIISLIFLALVTNVATLGIPKIIAKGIDSFLSTGTIKTSVLVVFFLVAVAAFIFSFILSIVQTYASEKVARDMRRDLSAKISTQSYLAVEKITPGKLLTNLTSDIDSIKNFVAQAIVNIASSVFIIVGASILLININWKLGLAVLTIVPIIGGTFFFVLSKVRKLFLEGREIIDSLNKVINESILGAALVRVLNSFGIEFEKFSAVNAKARDLGIKILKLFAGMIPVITFSSNLAVLIILTLGGHFVISGSMSLGNFAAFNSYLAILIFPILIIGFMSNIIAQAQASYGRIFEVLSAPEDLDTGNIKENLQGKLEVKNLSLSYGEKTVLKDVSFRVNPGSKIAIIGPTAAGKTQLLYALVGLIRPNSGTVEYDSKDINQYSRTALYKQIGFVFQDSIIFNMSIKENIAFNTEVTDEAFKKAIDTAELSDFIEELPEKMETVVSERGASLSGGQKQRIMLARALALNPKILFLDDFTARVDNQTETAILGNVAKNYPGLTLISVTQKISSVENYDQIIVLMEGELIAIGKHQQLMETSPDYVQIYNSQQSVNT
jgi:ATP-binding cassette subfamily B protein